MKWFKNDVSDKEALELYRNRLKAERARADDLMNRLAIAENAAVNVLRLYGAEAVGRFKQELKTRGSS